MEWLFTGREELQKRLQAKVSLMRAKRKADEQAKTATTAKEWRKTQLENGAKIEKKHKRQAKAVGNAAAAKNGKAEPAVPPADDAPHFVFNKLQVNEGDRKKHKGKPHTKQQMLKDAEQKLVLAEELGSTAQGKAQLKEEAWQKMMKLAQGEKILDNPQLLRRSIKKEEKLKAKKAGLWQNRVDATKEKQSKAQQKRHDNLQQRSDEKKAKKVAKREKKLMRAGFEGRKGTFI